MPGGEEIRAEGTRAVLEEGAELDVPVAREVGVGSRTAPVEVPQEGFEHGVPVLLHEIHLRERDTDGSRRRPGVALILLEAALAPGLLRLVSVSHQDPRDIEPRALEEPRGHRGIHPT